MTASRIAPPNEIRFSVRFAETDMARVYHHSNTFVWFEAGRFALIEKMIGGQPMIEVDGVPIFAPVTKTRVSFTGFARFGDELRLETFIKPQETTKLVFYYRLTKVGDGATVALGTTEHVTLVEGGRFLFRWPEAVGEKMKTFFSENPGVVTDGRGFDAKL
ncbi:acyl-CoA thioesterase [Microbacterium testaceum]|uniref:acyl-CoA thioesterase n=2 Tax=Microbacterium TaxID=33882 RepID=UPI0025FACB38|nr:acyl-CoA thioesterase [Microbacterium testaceum]MDZ5143574.1 acyl-CoA thioesterase [Microbacterium testaceum]